MNHESSTIRMLLPLLTLLALPVAADSAPPLDIYGFGDSLLDTGRVCPQVGYPSGDFGTCSNGRGTLQWLPDYGPWRFDAARNFAEGGAGTSSFNVASLVVPSAVGAGTQIERFVASGARLDGGDLVVYSAGPNNRFLIGPLGPYFGSQYDPTLTAEGLATRSAEETRTNIAALIGAGGRNFVVLAGRPREPGVTSDQIYFNGLNTALPGLLAGFAQDGTRLRIFDFQSLYLRATADPALYGLSEPFLYTDNTHPTASGHQLFARYISSLLSSADGIAAQADLAETSAGAFAEALHGRLRARPGADGRPHGFAMFLQPLAARTERAAWFSESGGASGFDSAAEGVQGGIEYRAGEDTRVGLALGYLRADAQFDASAAELDTDTVGATLYAAHRNGELELEASLAYAGHELEARRPGVIDTLEGEADGDSLTAGLDAAWLFGRAGALRLGPLLGLRYANTQIDAYTETGDDLLAQQVEEQELESLEIGGGLRLRGEGCLASHALMATLDLQAVDDVLAEERRIKTANVFAPGLPVYTLIDDDDRESRYLRLAGSVDLALGPALALTLGAQGRWPDHGDAAWGLALGVEWAL